MRPLLWLPILLFLQLSPAQGTSSEAPPAQEILQLMELLQEWEMIQNLELIRQMESAGQIENTSAEEATEPPAPQIQIEDEQKWNGNLR